MVGESMVQNPNGRRGVILALLAYLCWGNFPLFWSFLTHLDPLVVVAHRVFWSAIFLFILLTILGLWRRIWFLVLQPKIVALCAASGFLLAGNWLIYVWAVGSNQVIEASLGYFITPLMNVLLGAIFLQERLRFYQKIAVVLACLGVVLMAWQAQLAPWTGLAIAATFGAYGLLRKLQPIGSLEGLTLETVWMLPPAVGTLIYFADAWQAWGFADGTAWFLLGTGVVTTLPLLAFAQAARDLDLTTLGILQYLSPMLQFLLGVYWFDEPMASRWLGFLVIWLALLLFSLGGLLRR